jgi:hypothetical protein
MQVESRFGKTLHSIFVLLRAEEALPTHGTNMAAVAFGD